MKQGYTHILLILDRSSSMSLVAGETVHTYNQYIADQKKLSGQATLSILLFNHNWHWINKISPLSDAPVLAVGENYKPEGSTAMLDAIGHAIIDTGAALDKLPEDQKPDRVFCVIQTDGQENASKEFNYQKIHQMVKHQEEKYAWKFVFLGANIDAPAVASQMGVSAGSTMNYAANDIGTMGVGRSLGKMSGNFRAASSGVSGQSVANFDAEDKQWQSDAGAKNTP